VSEFARVFLQWKLFPVLLLALCCGCTVSAQTLSETSTDTLMVTVLGDTACSDGIDNDGDFLIDFPNDPGCGTYADTDETDLPVPQCSDGFDNDSDGLIDYPNDTGCDDANDDNEYVYSPPSSGGGGGGGGGSSPDSTSVRFRGKTFPDANLSLLKSGQVVETDTTGLGGEFDLRLGDLSEGQYNFTIFGIDPEGLRSETQAFNVSVEKDVTTSVTGVYMSPTIRLDKVQVKSGNVLMVDGYAIPSSRVYVYVDGSVDTVGFATSSVTGKWLYELHTSSVGYGDHTVRARVEEDSFESMLSNSLSFKVGLSDVFQTVTDSCGSVADLNYDCRVNLIDFSIAAYWYKRTGAPSHIDVNGDGAVDIKDFSIMAFHWTG